MRIRMTLESVASLSRDTGFDSPESEQLLEFIRENFTKAQKKKLGKMLKYNAKQIDRINFDYFMNKLEQFEKSGGRT